MKPSFTKLGWRISTAWRSGRSASIASRARPVILASRLRASRKACAVVRGSSAKNGSSRSGR